MMQSNRPTVFQQAWGIGLLGLAMAAAPASGAPVAYYTLDNFDAANTPGSGLKNLGSNGSNSDLTRFTANDASVVANGVIGSALSFAGNALYTTTTAGNAADALSSMPFTFSIWVGNLDSSSTAARAAIAVSPGGDALGNYFSLGVNGSEQVQPLRYNSAKDQTVTPVSQVALSTTNWYHLVGVFTAAQGDIKAYVDGKNVVLDQNVNNDAIGLTSNIDTLAIGGILRQLSGNPNIRAGFTGYLDDAGLFEGALDSADAALINGLGRLAGLGLDWHEQGRSLHDSALDTIMTLGTYQWQRVDGLSGSVGDIGGTVAGGDAYIITAVDGHGIKMVPEPAFAGGLFAAGMLLMRRARARA